MTTVPNTSDAAAKASTLVSNILLSLQASFGPNSAVEGLFANFLSQYQIPLPPAPEPQTPNAQTQISQNSDANASSNSNAASPDASNNAKTLSGWTQIGRVVHQSTPKTNDKTAAQNNPAGNSGKASSNPAASSQTSGNQAPTSNAASVASANSTNADSSPNGDQTDQTSGAASTTSDANAATAVTATADQSAPADATSTDANASAENTNGTQDDVSSELIALILQLERLAVTQSAALQANASTGPTQSTGVQTDPTQGTNSDPNGKLDLKGLLAAIAGLNNGPGDTADAQTSDASSADAQAVANTAFSASVTAPAPSTPASQASTTTDKLASTDFLSLFGLANNQNNVAPPLATFNPVAGANLIAGGDTDGESLDANAQGQNGAGTRDAATNLDANTAGTTLTAGSAQTSNPYDFASQLSALRASKGGTTGLPTPVEQVVLQLSRGLNKDGDSQMTIQLKPAELGRVEVKLNIASDGKVQGTVTADNSTTLGLLLKDSGGLERALQEAGLRADPGSLQFNLRGDGQQGQNFGQQAGNQSGSGMGGSLDASTTLGFTDTAETYYLTPGGVNMRV